ncbi:MAG: DUF1439 domain-containing protein [Burkholderiales bacterium]|nr:DUF1439 domain-containing protein [Burkholderiales bacterium]
MNIARRIRTLFLLAVSAAFLSACATMGGTKTMTFSDADMARMLESQAPFQKRLLDVLDVRINHPSVRLLPESNRLATDLEVSTIERISGKTYSGRIAVDYALRYDEAAHAIRMTQVRVNTLQIDNLPSPEKSGLNRLGSLIAEQLLNEAVLYRFKPSDLKNAEGYGYKPSAVTVTSRGVEVTLAPISR